jgi:hypothetical protein
VGVTNVADDIVGLARRGDDGSQCVHSGTS